MNDLEHLVDINVRRISMIDGFAGLALAGLTAFFLVVLAIMGFWYDIEVAQGLFVLAAPLTVIAAMNFKLASELRARPLYGDDLIARLFRVRLWTQLFGMVAIFATAVYGMYFVLAARTFF